MWPAESGGCGEPRQASAKGMRARRLRRLKLQLVKAGDRTFVVQDLDGQAFNQQDIERMVAAISPKQPA